MAASIETQRLISVSLGKIAQSRGQRGGINLHKNLLVATVLHKARTAYMMESYGYQQTLQRQKLQEQQQQQQQQVQPPVQVATSTPVSVPDKGEEVCQAPRDSNLGQPAATPARSAESGSESSTVTALDAVAPEPMTVHEVESEVAQDKENSPPVSAERLISLENVTTLNGKTSSDDYLAAATQLSQEAQSASEHVSVKQQNLTSATPTCNNVLKRRRDNPKAGSQDYECPVSKKARVSYESSYTFTDYSSDFSDISSDESESDSESESDMMQTSDSPQISNLVSIFNSGFSGLCAVSQDTDLSSSDYQSDLDISSSTSQLSSLSKLRSESPSPAYSRKMSEPSLLCSSQVGRLESLPSAILLSA